VNGPVVGGNLTVWNALSGTPFERGARDCIAFFEDIGESPSRIDRSVSQLLLSGRLDGARALVLGDFNGCNDAPPTTGTGKKARAIRPKVSTQAALKEIFGAAGERLRCPVFFGAPVGHGPGFLPLPLGGEIQIDLQGRVSLQRWDWDGC
jgi:muramoyltetrapeptide carboxypeptidase